MELEDREIEQPLYEPVILSYENMDKFEEQGMKKISPIK